MAEIITKDRKEYNIWDKINSKWNRLNFLTNAKSVDFDDGKTAQNKLGAIDGITSDLSGESETVAASIKCVNQLNSSLTANSTQFYFDFQNGKYGFNTDPNRGADTFNPFSSVDKIELFNVEFVNTDIATINHNASLSGGKITSGAITSGIWINTFNLSNKEDYMIVCEFTSTPSQSQCGYCTNSASLPTIISNGSGRQQYISAYEKHFSLQLSNTYGFFAGFVGTLEKVYLLKIK